MPPRDVRALTTAVRIVVEPVGTGTRCAEPMSLPLSSGMTRPIAFAAPVEFGTMSQRRRVHGGGHPSVRAVEDHLIAGVSVDRAHDAALDRRIVVEGLRHRREAVRRAARSGDDRVVRGEGLLVYAVNDRREIVAGRSGDDNLLCASVDVRLGLRLRGVEARALEDNVNADFAHEGSVSASFSA